MNNLSTVDFRVEGLTCLNEISTGKRPHFVKERRQ